MAFSLKKRVQSKLHIATVGDDDANALGAVLHRSTKTSKSKKNTKKCDQFLKSNQISPHEDDSARHPRSDNSASEQRITYRSECPCDTHYDKQLIEHDYDLVVDKLFDLMFGTNEFVKTYRQAQRIYDDQSTEWTMNDETQHRERVLNYKVPYESSLVGKGTISTCEKQILSDEVSGSHYILDTEVSNEGVKFSDTFSLHLRYCLVQTCATMTNLRVTAQIRFCKSVNSILKSLIERNAYSASQEGLKDLNNRLNLISNFKMEKRRLSRGDGTLKSASPENVRGRRMSRHDALAIDRSGGSSSPSTKNFERRPSSIFHQTDKPMFFLILMVGLILFIHLFLYLKLKHMDVLVDNLSYLIRISSASKSSSNH